MPELVHFGCFLLFELIDQAERGLVDLGVNFNTQMVSLYYSSLYIYILLIYFNRTLVASCYTLQALLFLLLQIWIGT